MEEHVILCTLDASVAFNLFAAGILDRIFLLPIKFLVSDLMLAEHQDEMCRSLTATQVSLSSDDIVQINLLARTERRLSISDLAAFVLCLRTGATLLTDDRGLRAAAISAGVTVHGSLWVLDQLVLQGILPACEAPGALQAMLDHGARLPQDECKRRVRCWCAGSRDTVP